MQNQIYSRKSRQGSRRANDYVTELQRESDSRGRSKDVKILEKKEGHETKTEKKVIHNGKEEAENNRP